MARVLVSGLINIETTLRVEQFPVHYNAVNYPFGGVNSTVSGVGLNVARALQILGHEVHLVSMVGSDPAGRWVCDQLQRWELSDRFVIETMPATPHSVIVYDPSGRRQIHVDLKNVQDTEYPPDAAHRIMQECDAVVLCNINFSRALIQPAKELNLTIATDVHALGNYDDAYNRDFMAAADILFLSHEHLPDAPEVAANALKSIYHNMIICVGMGQQGACILSGPDSFPIQVPAITTRPVVSTIGAGDALFSGFLHGWLGGLKPVEALRQAVWFASWKIGCASASDGFLNRKELADLIPNEG